MSHRVTSHSVLRISRRLPSCTLSPLTPPLGSSVVAMGYGLLPAGYCCACDFSVAYICLTFCSTAGARCSILQCPGIVSNVVCVDGPLADSPGVLVPAMLMSSAQVRLLIMRHSLNEIHEAESRSYRDTAAVRLCGRG